jgi:AraC-like DNA-binding protein
MKSLARSELNTFGLQVWGGSVETTYPPHRHNEIEFNALETGFLTYLLAGQEVTVAAGEVALFWAAIPHQVIDSAPQTRLYWATVPLSDVLRWDLPGPFVRAMLAGTFFREAAPLHDRRFFAQWSCDLAAGRERLALLEIQALCLRLAQTHPAPVVSGGGPASRMAHYMSARFQESLTVDEIAGQVGLQANYAMTIFKRAFGLSLIEYLTQQRIAHAQQLLITTDLPIADIALESGFPSLSHFYTAFGRLCGVAPGRYRAAMRGSS